MSDDIEHIDLHQQYLYEILIIFVLLLFIIICLISIVSFIMGKENYCKSKDETNDITILIDKNIDVVVNKK